MNKQLINTNLLYALRHISEFKGYLETFNDTVYTDNHKSKIDISLDSIKSAIQLLNENNSPEIFYEASSSIVLNDLSKNEEEQ